MTDRDAPSLYLDRIRRELTRYGMRERMPAEWSLRRRLLVKTYGTLAPIVMRINPFGERKRDLGLDLARGSRDDDRNAATHQSAALR